MTIMPVTASVIEDRVFEAQHLAPGHVVWLITSTAAADSRIVTLAKRAKGRR
jgi:hypothetical protein